MNTKPISAAGVATLAATFASAAAAEVLSARSGKSGNAVAEARVDPGGILRGLMVLEKANRPCAVQVHGGIGRGVARVGHATVTRPSRSPRIEAMADDGRRVADALAGTELAGEVLPGGRLALLAFLVRGDGEAALALELGAWPVADDGKLVEAARPLVLPLAGVDQVRTLVERAVAALPHAPGVGAEGVLLAVDDGGLGVTMGCAPDGTRWLALGRADGAGRAAVPADAADNLVRVLAEAERELVELGLVPFPGDPRG